MVVEGDSTPRRLGYQPALDGIRALAIAPVVVFHAFDWPKGGVLGVHIFFVLSGFLITTLLVQEWNRNGSISLRHFYFRRAMRLFPALGVMLGVYVLIQAARELVIEPQALEFSAAVEGVLYSVFYVSNVVQASGTILAVPLVPLWSLATEEQFYLLWPFLLVAALRLGARPRVLGGLLLGAIAVIARRAARASPEPLASGFPRQDLVLAVPLAPAGDLLRPAGRDPGGRRGRACCYGRDRVVLRRRAAVPAPQAPRPSPAREPGPKRPGRAVGGDGR